MKKLITLVLMLVALTFTSTPAFAGGADYLSEAKQNEARGYYGNAANDYINWAESQKDFGRRAEIYANDVVRMFLKGGSEFFEMIHSMQKVAHYDRKRANALLAKHELAARKSLVNYVSAHRSLGMPYEDRRNLSISTYHQFFPQGREALAEEFLKMAVAENHQYWYDLAAENSAKVASKIVKQRLGDVSKLTLLEKAKRVTEVAKYMADYQSREVFAKEFEKEGKRLAVIPGEETNTAIYRSALTELKGQDYVQANFPESVVMELDKPYVFKLNADEQVPFWLDTPYGVQVDIEIASTASSDFVVVYDDGKIFGKDEARHTGLEKRKFRAIKYSHIRITISRK